MERAETKEQNANVRPSVRVPESSPMFRRVADGREPAIRKTSFPLRWILSKLASSARPFCGSSFARASKSISLQRRPAIRQFWVPERLRATTCAFGDSASQMTNSIRSAKLSPIRMERQWGTVMRLVPCLNQPHWYCSKHSTNRQTIQARHHFGGASMLIQRQIPGRRMKPVVIGDRAASGGLSGNANFVTTSEGVCKN